MTMTLKKFLNRVVDDGIAAASESYKNDHQKRDGALAGFEACRGLSVVELRQLLKASAHAKDLAREIEPERYHYYSCYSSEVEWTCNVVSAVLNNEGIDPIVTPTMRGFMKAAEIVGVSGAHVVA
jgi:hypothetical protein